MKTKTICIWLLLLCPAISFAQNYNCLQFGPKNYFINGNGYVRGMRIDSAVTAGSNVIYHPYHTLRMNNYCPGPGTIDTGASWLGKNVVKQPDGTFIFDNLWDTVIIKTQAHLGDSWIFYNDTTALSYIATVTATDTMTMLGTLDSIKAITITADSAGITHPVDFVNNFQIVLSKAHGFAQVFDLYTFPYHIPSTSFFNPTIYGPKSIRGFDYYLDVLLNNLGTCLGSCIDNYPDTINSIFHLFPFHNPTTFEIYNYARGDVYESKYVQIVNGLTSQVSYTLDSVMGRYTDTTGTDVHVYYTGSEYTMIIQTLVTGFSTFTCDTLYTNSPIGVTGDSTLLINAYQMPEEYDSAGYLLHYIVDSGTTVCNTDTSYILSKDYQGTGFGYNGSYWVPSSTSSTHGIRFGWSGYSESDAPDLPASIGTTIMYGYCFFYRDSTACGGFLNIIQPLDSSLVAAHINTSNIIRIFPNPANTYFDITTTGKFSNNTFVSVYDISGQCVYRSPIEQLTTTAIVNTTQLPAGIYMAIVQDNSGILKKEKIVITR